MFRGRFEHNLDIKGRFSIPHRFREYLTKLKENVLIVTTELEFCLSAYPLLEWEKLESELSS
ncbi:MAG: cell division/cell wall cluster transcriptional repressor MraZ, partial [Thermodesulfobacteriota bacterium]|nr:cell division/cell wall cluster transcriptional repressor MraZ [Thermodesulfobacteriota bacterium]